MIAIVVVDSDRSSRGGIYGGPFRHCLLCCGLTFCEPCGAKWSVVRAAVIMEDDGRGSRWCLYAQSCRRHWTQALRAEGALCPWQLMVAGEREQGNIDVAQQMPEAYRVHRRRDEAGDVGYRHNGRPQSAQRGTRVDLGVGYPGVSWLSWFLAQLPSERAIQGRPDGAVRRMRGWKPHVYKSSRWTDKDKGQQCSVCSRDRPSTDIIILPWPMASPTACLESMTSCLCLCLPVCACPARPESIRY